MMSFWSKNYLFVLTLLVMGVVFSTALAPMDARADELQDPAAPGNNAPTVSCEPGKIIDLNLCQIVQFVSRGLDKIGDYLITGAESIFQVVLNLNSDVSQMESYARIGWTIIRDLANMFYIFILLWIALATIFDIDRFSAKTLLPKLIISALLINFSLVIGSTVIRITNDIGTVFFDQANVAESISYIGNVPILLAIKNNNPVTKDSRAYTTDPSEIDQKIEDLFERTTYADPSGENLTAAQCENKKGAYDGPVEKKHCPALIHLANDYKGFVLTPSDSNDQLVMSMLNAIPMKLILYPVAIFVIFAGAIFLFVRYISLIFILTLGPAAFLAMILPATAGKWSDWWKKLTNWSVFFPAYAILFYISSKIIKIGAPTISEYKIWGVGVPSTTAMWVQVFMGIAFFIGSLLAAQEFGIGGANAVIGYGKKLAKGAGDMAKRGALAPVRFAGTKLKEEGAKQADTILSKLQGTRFGQTKFIDQALAGARAATKATGEAEFKRKHGAAMGGSDESVIKYAASVARRGESGAREAEQILEKMGVEKRRKGLSKVSGAEATALGQSLSAIGADHLVRNASNNPETLVDLIQPELSKEVADAERDASTAATIARNPNLSADGVARAKEDLAKAQIKLQETQKKREDAIMTQFTMMNKANLNPEFIGKITKEMIANLSDTDLSSIASNSAGAKALAQKIEEFRKKARDAAYEKAFQDSLVAGSTTEDATRSGSNAAIQAHESMDFLKNEKARNYLAGTAGRVILRGGQVERIKSEQEKQAAAIAREIKDIEKTEGSANKPATPPPAAPQQPTP